MTRLFVLVAGLALCFAAAAQQFKWVDQDGRVQYGDTPPAGVKATRLRGPSSTATAPAAPSAPGKPAAKGGSTAEQDAAFRKRQEDAQKAAEKSAAADSQAAAKKENCARAQEYLRSLESGVRINYTDKQGERVYLDDDQRATETTKARQMVQQSCN